MNRGAHAQIRAAAAQIAIHCAINVRIGGLGLFRQQRARRHDLSGLAVTALRHVEFLPGDLHGMRAFSRKSFNRRYGLIRRR